jgi:hypothetical protein
LGGIYVLLAFVGWPVLMIALLGLAESAIDLRGRIASRLPPAPPM